MSPPSCDDVSRSLHVVCSGEALSVRSITRGLCASGCSAAPPDASGGIHATCVVLGVQDQMCPPDLACRLKRYDGGV